MKLIGVHNGEIGDYNVGLIMNSQIMEWIRSKTQLVVDEEILKKVKKQIKGAKLEMTIVEID